MNESVVIDIGTETIKCGKNIEKYPEYFIPTVTGYDKQEYSEYLNDANVKKKYPKIKYFGEDAVYADCVVKTPVEYGFPTFTCDHKITELEQLLSYILSEKLEIQPDETTAVYTVRSRTPKITKEKLTEVTFESFNFNHFYLGNGELMSLMSTGRTSGFVIECGDGYSLALPVHEGYSIHSHDCNLQIVGKDLSHYLLYSLGQHNGQDFVKKYMRNIPAMHCLKEACYVSSCFETEVESLKASSDTVLLPDGEKVCLRETAYTCPEIFFNPKINNQENVGLDEAVALTIGKCNEDIKSMLCSNIILGGGSTQFQGLAGRLEKEVQKKFKNKVKVQETRGRMSAWLGGSAISSLSTFNEFAVGKEEYDEYGPMIVHKKCSN